MKTILVGDIGSTSADWALVRDQHFSMFSTGGYNPMANQQEVGLEMVQAIVEQCHQNHPDAIYYYGTGVNGALAVERVSSCFRALEKSTLSVYSDILGAARSLMGIGEEKGVVAILGTGSNVCSYDHGAIVERGINLGYLLADEGSGTAIGRRLLKAFYYDQFPSDLQSTIGHDVPAYRELVPILYSHSAPNRFIASFARLAIEQRAHPAIQDLVASEFQEFIHSHLLKYKSLHKIHFVGSIAFYFCEVLRAELEVVGLSLGKIVRRPIEGLACYHQNLQQNG